MKSPTLFSKKLYTPKAIGMWFGLGVLWLMVKCLPRCWLEKMGICIGQLMRLFLPRRERIVATNIRLCFQDLPEAQQQKLIRDIFSSIGIGIIETGLAWWLTDSEINAISHIEGLEYLKQAQAAQKPIILCTGHFTTFEIAGRVLTNHITFNAMYRKQKNEVYNFLMHKYRSKRLQQIIPRNDVRTILAALKTQVPLWVAPDQDYGRRRSVFVPFFGISAASITSPAKLAKLTGSIILPYFSYRLPSMRYCLTFQPPLEHFPSGNLEKDTLRINRLIERGIRFAPEQYLWLHRRFKTRPAGDSSIY
jgi:KDO2-lipid IV(A) lauroyltransferase